jgi:hypothetical protein
MASAVPPLSYDVQIDGVQCDKEIITVGSTLLQTEASQSGTTIVGINGDFTQEMYGGVAEWPYTGGTAFILSVSDAYHMTVAVSGTEVIGAVNILYGGVQTNANGLFAVILACDDFYAIDIFCTNITVYNDATIGNDLSVANIATINTLVVTVNASVGGNLTVAGLTTTLNLNVGNNAVVAHTLTATTVLATTMTASGTIQGATVIATITFQGNGLSITGATSLDGTVLIIGGTFTCDSNAIFNGAITVAGLATFNGALYASNLITANDGIEVSGGSITVADGNVSAATGFTSINGSFTSTSGSFSTTNGSVVAANGTISAVLTVNGAINYATIPVNSAVVGSVSGNLVALAYTNVATPSTIVSRDNTGSSAFIDVECATLIASSEVETDTLSPYTATGITVVDGFYLPTLGGSPALFNYYQTQSLIFTCSGPWATNISMSIRFVRVGQIVTMNWAGILTTTQALVSVQQVIQTITEIPTTFIPNTVGNFGYQCYITGTVSSISAFLFGSGPSFYWVPPAGFAGFPGTAGLDAGFFTYIAQ